MKKLIAIVAILFSGALVHARDVYKSSTTNTSTAQVALCTGTQRAYLYGVCVSSPNATAGVTLFNSSFTTTLGTGFVTNATYGCVDYQTNFTSGLSYTKTGAANITIKYDCF